MSVKKELNGLESILREKNKILNATKERRTLLLNHERSGLSFVFYELKKEQLGEFREKLKERKINVESPNYNAKQEEIAAIFEAEVLAQNLKTMFLTAEGEIEETGDINLNDEKLKEAFGYNLHYEFFKTIMTDKEIDRVFTEMVGFSNTIKK